MHLIFFPLVEIGKFIQMFKFLPVILNSVARSQVERSLMQVYEYNGASFSVRAKVTGTEKTFYRLFFHSALNQILHNSV